MGLIYWNNNSSLKREVEARNHLTMITKLLDHKPLKELSYKTKVSWLKCLANMSAVKSWAVSSTKLRNCGWLKRPRNSCDSRWGWDTRIIKELTAKLWLTKHYTLPWEKKKEGGKCSLQLDSDKDRNWHICRWNSLLIQH